MNTSVHQFPRIERKATAFSLKKIAKTPFILLALTVAVLLVYWSVFSHQFQMRWDDQWVVLNEYTENGLNFPNLIRIFTEYNHGQYSPINQLSYNLIYAAAGYDYNPVWFHSYSIIMHILCVILTYFFIKNLLTQSEAFKKDSVITIAFCTAFIMAIHPFLVEPVAWMAASKIVLYSFFYLLALNCYLAYIKTKKIWYLFLIAFLFLLSFGSKEQAVTLPACMLLIDFVLKRNLKQRAVWFEKIPFIVLSLIFAYVTLLSQRSWGVGLLAKDQKYPFYQNIIFGSYALTEYFVKCLIPIKLMYAYVFPNQIGEQVPWRFWIYPPLLVIIFITLRSFFKQRWMFFALAFFVIHLMVALHVVPISRFSIVADRYAYIASIAVFFGISYYFDKAIRSFKYRNMAVTLMSVYVVYLGAYAHVHAKVWHDSELLKKEVIEFIKQEQESEKRAFKAKHHDTN